MLALTTSVEAARGLPALDANADQPQLKPCQQENITMIPELNTPNGHTVVCMDRADICGFDWDVSIHIDPEGNHLNDLAPARWAEIEWQNITPKGDFEGVKVKKPLIRPDFTGRTDENGHFRGSNPENLLCGVFPLNSEIQTRVRFRSPGPEGNQLYTAWNTVNFSTFNGKKAQNHVTINGFDRTDETVYNTQDIMPENVFGIIGAPYINEKIIAQEANVQNLPKDTLPMLVNYEGNYPEPNGRVSFDYDRNLLIYDGSKTGNSEAGQYRLRNTDDGVREVGGFITGDDFPLAPEYSLKGSGLLEFDYIDVQFDYESSLAGGLNLFDIKGLFGAGEIPAGYSNFKIYVVNSESLSEMFNDESQICEAEIGERASPVAGLQVPEDLEELVDRSLNLRLNQASPVEVKFLQTVLNHGGIAGANLPSYFLSSNANGEIYDLAEFFNTQKGKNMSSGAAGKTHYKNLPFLSEENLENKSISILVVESDSRLGNDIVHCEHNININQRIIDNNLVFNNAEFLENIGWTNDYLPYGFKGYTFEMKLKLTDSIEVR